MPERSVDALWSRRGVLAWSLTPLSLLMRIVVGLRRHAYRLGLKRIVRLPVPVIVVGNITVGGTGKTPFVAWLCQRLAAAGYRPGIISRGYGGRADSWPVAVTADTDPVQCGDEPVMLAAACQCPVYVGPDRVAAARALLDAHDCDVLIADDGLQHYRLGRDIEIAMVDGLRQFVNGFCLPAGPLREPVSRLKEVDLVVHKQPRCEGTGTMCLEPTGTVSLATGDVVSLESWRGRRAHAVAGIGSPQRFFAMLREAGLNVIEHPFPDHHDYSRGDMAFNDDLPVLMTEKDAVKYKRYATDRHAFVKVEARVDEPVWPRIKELLEQRILGRQTA